MDITDYQTLNLKTQIKEASLLLLSYITVGSSIMSVTQTLK